MRRAPLLLLAFLPLAAVAQTAPPPLTGRVVDLAGILADGTEATLTVLLEAHEDSTTNQVAVLTIPSLGGEAVEPYATRVFNTWGLGQAERDNGVLLVIARDDRELRIEVGYGLEAALTDAEAGRIIRNVIVPAFRSGDFDGGTLAGVGLILQELSTEPGLAASPLTAPSAAAYQRGLQSGEWFLLVLTLLLLLIAWRLAWGWGVKTGGKSAGWRRFSFIVRLIVGGALLGFALYGGAYLLRSLTPYGRYEWWAGIGYGFLAWPVLTLLDEARRRRSPVWQRYRQMQRWVEAEKEKARRLGKKVTIHTWGGPIEFDGTPAPVSSGSSGSSWSDSSSSSSSSFSGGGGSSGGGGASGSW